MKKLFFFRSSGSNSANNNPVPPPSTAKQTYWENASECGVNDQANNKAGKSFRSPRGSSNSRKQLFEGPASGSSPCLRRSLSFSSASFHEGGLRQKNLPCFGDQNGSSCNNNDVSRKRPDHQASRFRTRSPERESRPKCFETPIVQNTQMVGNPDSVSSSRGHYDSSESSSNCSSNVSNKVVDRYIDGEQEQERSTLQSDHFLGNHIGNRSGPQKHPPPVQCTAPASPTDSMKDRPRSHSFRRIKGNQFYLSSRDCIEDGFGHESPRRLAKHVIERLSQCRALPKTNLKEFDPDGPITIEDIYTGSLNGFPISNPDGFSPPSDDPDETNGFVHKEISACHKGTFLHCNNYGLANSAEAQDDVDLELLRKSKEAEERVLFLAEELEQVDFLEDNRFSVTSLMQTIRNLTEDRVSMAREISSILHAQIAERASTREELRLVRAELDSRTRRLEKEKKELQSTLEKELDRRSSDWSFKLEKYQAEEHRLRERVRELAEQNVALQRDVTSLSEREMESKSHITDSELQLKELTTRIEEIAEENQHLQKHLAELQEKYRAAKEDQDCIKRNYKEKDKECKELHRSVTRLVRTCNEQEKTIDGLQKGLSEDLGKSDSSDNFNKQLGRLQMEQIRLTGVEQTLRKEVESYRLEVDSLRHENVNLLRRLKVSSKDGGLSSLKLDQELMNRVCCIQNQGLSLVNESTQLSMKLLGYIKVKAGQTLETEQNAEPIKNVFDGQFVVESDMKVQGFKRGAESLARSLQKISALLNEKSNPYVVESHSQSLEDGSGRHNDQNTEETLRSELKAETLLTSLLREKLYSKEIEVEQLQAELAAVVRGNDMLRCEIQNALDNLSCLTHEKKDLELQMIKKDESINQLQNDLQECMKELNIIRGILPKVSEERDLMWDEVKSYSERNMLLHSEVNMLKKKIEALDEDILLKEGQISILKDSLGKPFNLLASPDSM
ncbi:hypothetical protein NMG60_11036460 [Bertholletia excelsa]